MPRQTVLFAIALLLTAASFACGGGDSAKSAYVEQNEALLDSLPAIPGSRLIRTTSTPYYASDAGGDPIGYTTNAVFQAPVAYDARQVIEYYGLALQDTWSYELRQTPISSGGEEVGRVLTAEFSRGRARISLTTDGMVTGTEHSYEVAVDYGGGDEEEE